MRRLASRYQVDPDTAASQSKLKMVGIASLAPGVESLNYCSYFGNTELKWVKLNDVYAQVLDDPSTFGACRLE